MKQLVALLLFLLPTTLLAWGEKGHLMANEAATWNAPTALPSFFHRAYPQLVYLGPDPDRIKGGGPSIDSFNPPNHFLDSEYAEGLTLPPDRYDFIQLMTESGRLRLYAIENSTTGFLPWQIAETAEELVVQWRLWRSETDREERSQIEDNIVRLAGVLGHFAADAGNPHHATINYNGWVQENPERFRYDCDTHSRFESQFVARAIELDDVLAKMQPLRERTDFFAAGLELIRQSHSELRTLYGIDRDYGFDSEGTPQAREFAATRIAAGASLLRDLWWSSWVASAKEPERRRR